MRVKWVERGEGSEGGREWEVGDGRRVRRRRRGGLGRDTERE